MTSQRGPRLVFSLTCDGCECHNVKPDGRRYRRALNGSRMDHDGVHEDCPHLGAPLTATRSSEFVGLRHEVTEGEG